MFTKTSFIHAMLVVILAVLLYCQGCTIKFKATDVELDSVAKVVYKFDGFELNDGESR